MDLFQLLSSQDINWWTGVVWITCGLLWCFYQLFGLWFWRHPFTAEHPLLRHWCSDTFLQIWWRNKLILILDGLRWAHFLQTAVVPFRGNFELRPLGVAMGDVVSVTRVWSIHIKTPPVGRRQPMTSLPARPQYKGAPGKYVILFFVFNDCSVWSVHSTGKNDFLLLLWRALARHLGDVCIRVLVIWHLMTHMIFASFVWARSTHAMFSRERSACTVSFSWWESSALVCLSFRGRRGSRLLPTVQDSLLPRHWGEWSRGARRRSWPMS